MKCDCCKCKHQNFLVQERQEAYLAERKFEMNFLKVSGVQIDEYIRLKMKLDDLQTIFNLINLEKFSKFAIAQHCLRHNIELDCRIFQTYKNFKEKNAQFLVETIQKLREKIEEIEKLIQKIEK